MEVKKYNPLVVIKPKPKPKPKPMVRPMSMRLYQPSYYHHYSH